MALPLLWRKPGLGSSPI
ncbi:uncharacterized protein FTOL_13226 [Fusarium torulosum]|uniref:Uncharacterized protein n=1 Tax=Fusarium torulosum TaxID=33205 RepID=A0AAE8MME3_9HYPO|nr:uncharacterized protein FTOL_13226 [Fusarium torulosum]